MKSRRKYEYLEEKTKVIEAFQDNKNLKIFGDSNDNMIS